MLIFCHYKLYCCFSFFLIHLKIFILHKIILNEGDNSFNNNFGYFNFFFASLKKIFFSIYFKYYTINYDSKESNNIVYEEQYFKKTKCIDFLHLHVNDPRQRTIKQTFCFLDYLSNL